MSDKHLVVEIVGREAIPVRAIPYITGWRLSPDKVAQQLSGEAEIAVSVLGGIAGYRLSAGVPIQVFPKEWDAILASLYMLQHQLQNQYPKDGNDHVSPDFGYAAWREQSPFKLPADVFVWKDEFEPAFYDAHSPKNLTLLDERRGDRRLTYAPLLPVGVTPDALLGVFNASMGAEQAAPAQAGDEAKVSGTAPVGVPMYWQLRKPDRMNTMQGMVYKILKAAHDANEPRVPAARDVMDAIEAARLPDFHELSGDELKYFASCGKVKTANVESIRKRISRLTE